MKSDNVFDLIILSSGEQLHGIVDYVNKKHVYFFDFSNVAENSETDITMIAVMWRYSEVRRFSVYCTIYFPHIELPRVNLIHKNNIDDSSADLSITPKEKQQKQSIKYQNSTN